MIDAEAPRCQCGSAAPLLVPSGFRSGLHRECRARRPRNVAREWTPSPFLGPSAGYAWLVDFQFGHSRADTATNSPRTACVAFVDARPGTAFHAQLSASSTVAPAAMMRA